MILEGFPLLIIRLVIFVLASIGAGVFVIGQRRGTVPLTKFVLGLFALYAVAWISFTAFLWINHIDFPLNLEAMELPVVQHLRRIMAGQVLYVEPSPDFVPLAYAPLYYYLTVPFAWIFGANLFTLRLVAILGMLGSGLIIFLAVKKYTQSYWWGLIAAGLFAAAYRAMDTYLDNAHSDSWLLFTVLLGCYLIDLKRSRTTNLLAVVLLAFSFWFKQHGALFAIGGVLYLTWREGLKSSWLYWALAGILGPLLYLSAPYWLFGEWFHYYTYTIPSHWSVLSFGGIKRFLGYAINNYLVLASVGTVSSLYFIIRRTKLSSIWFFMFPFAVLSGFMGALDPGSNNNVFIPMGVWFILTGILGLFALFEEYDWISKWGLHLISIGASFALFFYNPVSVISSPRAPESYRDMIGYLQSLDGPVYAPWLGQLEQGYTFTPAVHWVPMEDLVRGRKVYQGNHASTQELLDSVIHPDGNAYILTNYPLENDALLNFLLDDYRLKEDLGDRFAPLSTLPKRYNLEYPRFLYEYVPLDE